MGTLWLFKEKLFTLRISYLWGEFMFIKADSIGRFFSLDRFMRTGFVVGACALCVLQGCSNGAGSTSPPTSPTPPTSPQGPTVTAISATYSTQGAPFEAVATSTGDVFVSVTADGSAGSETGVQVFTPAMGGALQSSCVNELPVPLLQEGAETSNLSILPAGINVGAGIGGPGAIFYNLAALETCTATGFVVSQGSIASDQGTQEVAVTPDGKYAFVSNEYGVAAGASTEGNIGVVQLQLDANGNVSTGTTLLGQISTGGEAIAGMTLSPDGTRLYVTSEIAAAATTASGGSNPVLARTGCVQQSGGPSNINGLLTVIDVATAEISPNSTAVLATVDAGCSPVRMSESANGSVLWVAVRGDNRVLAFSPSTLESNPNSALLGYASTGGAAPVGIRLFHNDELLAVANSNRFGTGIANATILYVADPTSASVVQTVATGLFPREITVGPDDSTLYLTNYQSDSFQVITTTVN
jgi:DNA-binding beta-propeller fold protein YncE